MLLVAAIGGAVGGSLGGCGTGEDDPATDMRMAGLAIERTSDPELAKQSSHAYLQTHLRVSIDGGAYVRAGDVDFFSIDTDADTLSLVVDPTEVDQVRFRLYVEPDEENHRIFNTLMRWNSSTPLRASLTSRVVGEGGVLEDSELRTNTRHFLNYNFGSSQTEDPTTILVGDLSFDEVASDAEPLTITLAQPRVLKKHPVLRSGQSLMFSDVFTLTSLGPEHLDQLQRLRALGHSTIIVGVRNDARLDQLIEAFEEHPELQEFDIIYSIAGLVRFCDSETRDSDINPDLSTSVRSCPRLGDVDDPNRNDAIEVLGEHMERIETLGARVVGVYAFDEVSSAGVDVRFQADIYRYIQTRRPDLSISLSHSWYIGHAVDGGATPVTSAFGNEFAADYISPASADVVLLSHYSIPALLQGDNSRQQEMLSRMETLGMMRKPYVKIFGTTLHTDKQPQCSTFSDHLGVFSRTAHAASVLSAASRANWTGGAFWGFYDRGARPPQAAANTTWEATFAYQDEDYCQPQFNAVRAMSRRIRDEGSAL